MALHCQFPTSHVLQTRLWCHDCSHSPWVQSVTSDVGFPSSFCAGPIHLSAVFGTVRIMPFPQKNVITGPAASWCLRLHHPHSVPTSGSRKPPPSPYLCMKQGEADAGPGQQQEALSGSARGCFQTASSVL